MYDILCLSLPLSRYLYLSLFTTLSAITVFRDGRRVAIRDEMSCVTSTARIAATLFEMRRQFEHYDIRAHD